MFPQVKQISLFKAHHDCIYALISDKKNIGFLSGGGDRRLLYWQNDDPSKAIVKARLNASIYVIQHINEQLLIADNQGGTYLIDPENLQLKAENNLGIGVFDVCFNHDEHLIYFALATGILVAASSYDLQIRWQVQLGKANLRIIKPFSNDLLLIGDSQGIVYFFNPINKHIGHQYQAHDDAVFGLLKYSDKVIYSGGKDAMLKKWTLENEVWNESIAVPAHWFAINQIIELSGTPWIATASRDKSIKIWDRETLILERVIDRTKFPSGHTHSVNRMIWFEDSQLLVSASDDRQIISWQLNSLSPS